MNKKSKVLLMLLPFHPPLIPPLGIACLKAYLQANGFDVKAVNANRNDELSDFYNQYLDTLRSFIPADRQANFYNIGNEVLRNHLMGYINHTSEDLYAELVRVLVYNTFFVDITGENVAQLNAIVSSYFAALEQYVMRMVAKEKPEVFGLSVFKGTLPSSMFAFDVVKKAEPGVMTVMGGGVFADQLSIGSPDLDVFVERTPYIDKIILGEGEYLFLKLLKGQLPESQKVFSRKDFESHFVDVSKMPLPDFSDFDVDYYPYLANYSSRSCPFQCSFCGETVLWGRYRKKKPEQIVSELAQLSATHNRRNFLLCDSLLNPTVDGLSNGLRLQGETVFFDGYLRVDPAVCDVKNTVRWRCGGFYRARLGVESGSPRVLELMDKKITTHQIQQAVSSLAYAGIKTTTYWIVGYPGETEEDFQQTLDLLAELKDDIYEAEANPFWYYPNALVKSDDWSQHSASLHPEEMTEMLLMPTRVLNIDPTPRERYLRLNRFVEHCRKLGIPNPYSLADIYKADERWKRLHSNSVPALTDFYSGDNLTAFRRMRKENKENMAAPLSHLQRFRWELEHRNHQNGNPPRTERLVVELEGDVEFELLQKAWSTVLNRHAILTATFHSDGDAPEQRAGANTATPIVYKEGNEELPAGGRMELYGALLREVEQGIDLLDGPALVTMLYKIDEQRFVFLLSCSALSLDRQSAGLILRELLDEYNELPTGKKNEKQESTLQYIDYSTWNQERLNGGELEHQRIFWEHSLKSVAIKDYLSNGDQRQMESASSRVFQLCFPLDFTGELKRLAKEEGTTIFAVVFALLGAWLAIMSKEPEIVIGTEFDCRIYPEQQLIAGPMTNILPVVLYLSGNPVFRQALHRTLKTLAKVDRNRDFPVDVCWKSRLPILFNYNKPVSESLRIGNLSVRELEELDVVEIAAHGGHDFLEFPYNCSHDLRLDLRESGERIKLFVRFNREKYQDTTIQNLFTNFLSLGQQLVSTPDAHLSQVDSCEENLMDELF